MRLPRLNAKADQLTLLNQFMGVNKNYSIQDSEFSDMKNITNDYFPVLANRKKRGIIRSLTKPQGFLGGQYLAYVDDDKLYYNENMVKQLAKTGKDRQLVMMGAYLVVFPDGYIYNTYSKEEATIENETSADGVTITLCKLDGTAYNGDNTVVSDTEPEDKKKYWLDTSGEIAVIKMYSDTYSSWTAVATTYVKFEASGIGKGFAEYDAVHFAGVDTGEWCYNGYDFNQNNIIYACGDDYLIVAGLINLNHTNSKTITFKRELPQMDFVCEQDNRIWGCSSDNHEIYACKQGDPKNWYFYGGLDSDAYAVSVGSEDVFTGAIAYAGYVFFYKENGYHKLYGTKPSNYELTWKAGKGVQKGSERSLVAVSDYIVYKARDGVCMYDGTTTKISDNLGLEPYYDAVAGAYRDKYFISMRDADYNYRLYVYDTTKGTWVIEDDLRVKYMAMANAGFYVVDYSNQMFVVNNEFIEIALFPMRDESHYYPSGDIYPGNGAAGDMEEAVEWSFETGDIGMMDPYHKYIKRLLIRLLLETETKMRIEIMYDSSGEWINLMEYYATRKRSYEIPVVVRRCDHCRLRFSGLGDFKLFSIAKATEEGSGR